MHYAYPKQLEFKRQRVVDALERIGKLSNVMVQPCLAAPHPLAYRNKIQLPVQQVHGRLILGLYAHRTHDLIDLEGCTIHCPLGEQAYRIIRKLLSNSPISAYDPETGRGELRHILLKTAVFTHQVLVVLVTQRTAPSPALCRLADGILDSMNEIQGVLHNAQPRESNAVLGARYTLLAGEESIVESLCGLSFKVSPASFFQVNPHQAEMLYRTALERAALTGEESVLDAYCGVGTLALFFAQHAKEVLGTECVPDAIQDAQENAALNGIQNARFVCAHAEEFIQTLDKVDVVLLNPPRKGCAPEMLQALLRLQPQRILYISCDPDTLARDLSVLVAAGWQLGPVQPFDMFPQTAHVETLAVLTR